MKPLGRLRQANPILLVAQVRRVSDGFLRSPSTSIVRAPELEISSASDTATVDLPWLGKADVSAITFPISLPVIAKSAASFIERTASVNRENGSFATCHNKLLSRTIVLGPTVPLLVPPDGLERLDCELSIESFGSRLMQSNSSAASTWSPVRNTRSDKSRSRPTPSPSTNARYPPSPV